MAMRGGFHEASLRGINRVKRHAALLGSPFGRILKHRSVEFFEAFAILFDEARIEIALLDDVAHDAQQKCQLIAGTHSDPLVGEHIGASVARVNGHYMAAVFANFLEFLDLDRAHRLVATRVEQHDVFGVGGVEHRRRTQKGLIRSIDIGIGKRGIVIVVRRTNRSHEAFRIPRIGCAAILEQRYLAARARNVAGDVSKSIIPAHLGKATFAVGFHGLGHAIFGSRERRQALATAAHISARMRMAFGAHKAPQFSTAHPSFDAAFIRTTSAQRRFGVRNRGI